MKNLILDDNYCDQFIKEEIISSEHFLSLGEYKKAEKIIMKALELNPLSHHALHALAKIKYHQQQIDVSIFLIRKALSYKKCSNYYDILAVLYYETDNLDKAKEYANYSLEINPISKTSLALLCNLSVKLRNKEDIKKYAKLFLQHYQDVNIKFYLDSLKDNKNIMSTTYVSNLFDSYSDNFEEHLTKSLNYQAPLKIAQFIKEFEQEIKYNLDLKIMDLGCGTGLMAKEINEIILPDVEKIFWGIDISSKMLERAKEKNIYKKLIKGEINQILSENNKKFHLITAADVFVYIGDVSEIFTNISHNLTEHGLFTLSIESNEKIENYIMPEVHMRYLHNPEYIISTATKNNMKLLQRKSIVTRYNAGQEVMGEIFLFQKL